MKSSIVLKCVCVYLLCLFFLSYSLQTVAFAETDPNTFVADCLKSSKLNDKECGNSVGNEEKTPNAESQTDTSAISLSAWDYIKTLFALLFVIGLLFGLLKFVNRKNRSYNKNRFMKNLGGISLGQQKSIQLVVIGDSYYLIGIGDEVRLLKEITDPQEIERLVEFYEEDGMQSPTGVLDVLLTKLSGKGKKDQTAETAETNDFGNLFKSKLDEMKKERERQISRLTEKERNRDE